MQRDLYTADHEAFRDTVREFISRHVQPHYDEWEKAGICPREAWVEAGKQGLLGTDIDEQYGGGGIKDFRYNAIIRTELTKAGAQGLAIGTTTTSLRRTSPASPTMSRSNGGFRVSATARSSRRSGCRAGGGLGPARHADLRGEGRQRLGRQRP